MTFLTLLAGWIVALFVGGLGITILVWIWRGKISLYRLISEPNGDASLSRFQFLIFTFVISLSLFLIIVGNKNGPSFPGIPPEILTLLGISGSSYLVSKAIQFSSPAGVTRPTLVISPLAFTQTAAGAAVPVLTVSATGMPPGTTLPAITWSLDAPAHGNITAVPPNQAQYTPPAASPGAATRITIRAKAAGFEDATAIVTLA